MQRTLILFLSCFTSFCAGSEGWLEHVQNRIDEDAVMWLRKKLSESTAESKPDLDKHMDDQCKTCFSGGFLEMVPRILVFMSFSVPDDSWIQLSTELEKYKGVFVVRGLPENSFQAFVKKLTRLKNKGLNVDVQVNPQLFKQYGVTEVPTIVLLSSESEGYSKVEVYSGSNEVEKITGNISLKYALEVFKKHESSRKKSEHPIFSYSLPTEDDNKKKAMGMP